MEAQKMDLQKEPNNTEEFHIEKQPKILIVEDDITMEPIWARIISTAFRHATYDWAITEPQAEAYIEMALHEGKQYDLVISDIFLSGTKTGIDLWHKFHQEMQGNFIIVSGIDYFKMLKHLDDTSQAPFFIKKPLVIRDCVEAIYTALNRPKY